MRNVDSIEASKNSTVRNTWDILAGLNVFGRSENPFAIGVLEIGSRACKLVLMDVRDLQDGFTWKAFRNQARLTHLGQLISPSGEMPIEDVDDVLIPVLREQLRLAKQLNVDHLYCVGTASLRRAINRESIQSHILSTVGLRVAILDEQMESQSTFLGYAWSSSISSRGNYLLVDQGGGSTELTIFSGSKVTVERSFSYPVGTLSFANQLLKEHRMEDPLGGCLESSAKQFDEVNIGLFESFNVGELVGVVGVGSAITNATLQIGNQRQHGVELSITDLQDRILESQKELVDTFPTFGQLVLHMSAGNTNQLNVPESLVTYFGLRVVLHILQKFNQDSISVNGVGLRYGICSQILQYHYPNLEQMGYQDTFASMRKSVGGIIERTWVNGTVGSITDFGVFVHFKSNVTGLIHRTQLTSEVLIKGDSVDVFVRRIYQDEKGNSKIELFL